MKSAFTSYEKCEIMWKKETKFYVVWKWKKTWIFESRNDCKKSVNWFPDAKYKSFSSIEDAKLALDEWWEKYYNTSLYENADGEIRKNKKNDLMKMTEYEKNLMNEIVPFFSESIIVDAACSSNPWKMEYRWVDSQTWEQIFHEKFAIWTNNIGEFLAIVHWLKFLWNMENKAIYSDSKIAISRVNLWKCKTKLNMEWENGKKSDFIKLKSAIQDAEMRLKKNGIKHKILKWNTEDWGEIPADFGRK